MYYSNDVIEEIRQSRQLAVFGAGAVAEAVVKCLVEEPYRLHIACCIVSDLKNNPKHISGIPVIRFSAAKKMLRPKACILVAVAEKNLEAVRSILDPCDQFRVIFMTYESDLWSLIRGNYYRELRLARGKPYLTWEEELERINVPADTWEKRVGIYTVRSHADQMLKEDVSRYSWEIPIQAGASLTDQCICGIRDDKGVNISSKNRKYCELTALYWIWKNDTSAYVGLGHYRRHFDVEEEQLKKLVCSDIDVVLTIPIFDFPSVEAVYRRDHVEKDWFVMLEALQKLQPDYLDTAKEVGKGQFYYAYNMFIMRREILAEYCEWLFPVLAYCEMHCTDKEDVYQNRYIGFLAEHLMAIYFFHHENTYKIVHARKHFIENGRREKGSRSEASVCLSPHCFSRRKPGLSCGRQ